MNYNHSETRFHVADNGSAQWFYPRAVRLLVGTEGSVVNTCEDFTGLDCAFPSFAHSRVLNMWLPKLTAERLFKVALDAEQGKGDSSFSQLPANWKKVVFDFLNSRKIAANPKGVFRHVANLAEGQWRNIDCLQIGLRLQQVGYKKKALIARACNDRTQAERTMLIFCMGLVPIFLAAMYYRNVLSFPDLSRYLRDNCANLERKEKGDKKRGLRKQLEEFQKTCSFKPLDEYL